MLELRDIHLSMNNALSTFLAAQSAVNAPGFESLSKSTQNRKWAAYFKAEDMLKATAQGVAR